MAGVGRDRQSLGSFSCFFFVRFYFRRGLIWRKTVEFFWYIFISCMLVIVSMQFMVRSVSVMTEVSIFTLRQKGMTVNIREMVREEVKRVYNDWVRLRSRGVRLAEAVGVFGTQSFFFVFQWLSGYGEVEIFSLVFGRSGRRFGRRLLFISYGLCVRCLICFGFFG